MIEVTPQRHHAEQLARVAPVEADFGFTEPNLPALGRYDQHFFQKNYPKVLRESAESGGQKALAGGGENLEILDSGVGQGGLTPQEGMERPDPAAITLGEGNDSDSLQHPLRTDSDAQEADLCGFQRHTLDLQATHAFPEGILKRDGEPPNLQSPIEAEIKKRLARGGGGGSAQKKDGGEQTKPCSGGL
jgi:hypothetical protein